MALTLESPLSVGELDSHSYDTIKITEFYVNVTAKQIKFSYRYGYMLEGEFVAGIMPLSHVEVRNTPPDGTEFDDFAAIAMTEGTFWDANARTLYQWLIDNKGLEGEIV